MQDQLKAKQAELDDSEKSKKKSLKRIQEGKATRRRLNDEIHNISQDDIYDINLGFTTKASQEKNSQRSFISIDPTFRLSTNLQVAQWPLGYKFDMLPIYDRQFDPRQFLMSFQIATISWEVTEPHWQNHST